LNFKVEEVITRSTCGWSFLLDSAMDLPTETAAAHPGSRWKGPLPSVIS